MPPFAWYKLFNVYNLHVKYTALENTWRALGCILLNSMNRRYKQNIRVICFFNDVFSTNYTAEGNYCKIHSLHIWSRIVIKKDFWHSTIQSIAATRAYEIHFNNTITCTQRLPSGSFSWKAFRSNSIRTSRRHREYYATRVSLAHPQIHDSL